MKTKLFYRTLVIAVLFLALSCGRAGTKVSNPAPETPKNTITFATVTSDTSSEASTSPAPSIKTAITSVAAATRKVVTPSESYCSASPTAETQICSITSGTFHAGILAIDFNECVDSDGAITTCRPGFINFENTQRLSLYNAAQVDMTFDTAGVEFGGDLAEITGDISMGGVQIVLAYFGETFPSNGAEAEKIIESLRGKTYRVCTTPDDQVDDATMLTRCGNAEAQEGDFMLVNSDGTTTAFFDETAVTAASIGTTTTRPADYSRFNLEFYSQITLSDDQYTTTAFYGVAGYFAPLFPTTDLISLSTGLFYDVALTLNVFAGFQFTDGAAGDNPPCVSAVSDVPCVPDTDPDTAGVYHPFYDSADAAPFSAVTVSVTEASD